MSHKSMFEQAIRTLAAIDDALGIGDECADPCITLDTIAELKAEAERGKNGKQLLIEAANFIDNIRVGVTVKARTEIVNKLREFCAE